MQIESPFHIDLLGKTALADKEVHIREMIEAVLFTSPGERVNRPEFGSGLLQLTFAPNSGELATATQFLVQGALLRWLGDRIQVEAVRIKSEESTLEVTVQYILRRDGERKIAQFSREV